MHIALIWCVSEFISVTWLSARWFGTKTIKLVVVISGEVNDDILQTSTCNLQPSLCIALHHVKHIKMFWVKVYAGLGGVVGVMGSGWWWCCGSRLWVLWVRGTPLEYLHQLSDSMPNRMRMVLEANGNPLKYYILVRLNCKTVLNSEIKYICINISFYIDQKDKGTG